MVISGNATGIQPIDFGKVRQAFYQYVHRAVRYSYVLVRAAQYQPQAGTRWCSTAAVVVPVQPVPKQY